MLEEECCICECILPPGAYCTTRDNQPVCSTCKEDSEETLADEKYDQLRQERIDDQD